MNPVVLFRRLFWAAVTTLSGVATGLSGYLVVRGPLLGGQALDPQPLIVATGVFVVGIIVFTLGGTKFVSALRA